jgi:hypothetical protein
MKKQCYYSFYLKNVCNFIIMELLNWSTIVKYFLETCEIHKLATYKSRQSSLTTYQHYS